MFKRIALVTLLAATTAITGCANSDVYSGDVYTKDRAKQVQTVSYGTIISTRPVKIQADENSLIGTIGGAVVGGLLGSTVGGGDIGGQPLLQHRREVIEALERAFSDGRAVLAVRRGGVDRAVDVATQAGKRWGRASHAARQAVIPATVIKA